GFTLSELLVSLAVLGLIAGLTAPSVVNSVEISRQKAVLKEDIQAISQIIQEGYLDGTFASITNWSVLNTTDPIVQYFTSKLGGVVKQCARGTVTGSCNTYHDFRGPTSGLNDHSGRWVLSNGTTIALVQGVTNGGYISFTLNGKPEFNNGIGKQMAILCNIADVPLSVISITGQATSLPVLKSAQCGTGWAATYNATFYPRTNLYHLTD
ncbi:MAG: type II secretion system protein, partial [Candidatus Melainabacteria bacterium]|nr:type II secretion system protein [Candidatus Melainabacteria bacterium]